MKLRVDGLQRTADRWPLAESLFRSCQLVLLFWLAFHGAQFAAKGVVQAGTMLAGLLR